MELIAKNGDASLPVLMEGPCDAREFGSGHVKAASSIIIKRTEELEEGEEGMKRTISGSRLDRVFSSLASLANFHG